MADPFRPDTKSQLLREAQIGLSIVAILLVLLVYVAFYRITGRGRHLPDHVRNAPIAELVWPGEKDERVAPREIEMSAREFRETRAPKMFRGSAANIANPAAEPVLKIREANSSVRSPYHSTSSVAAMAQKKTSRPEIPLDSPNFSPNSKFNSPKPSHPKFASHSVAVSSKGILKQKSPLDPVSKSKTPKQDFVPLAPKTFEPIAPISSKTSKPASPIMAAKTRVNSKIELASMESDGNEFMPALPSKFEVNATKTPTPDLPSKSFQLKNDNANQFNPTEINPISIPKLKPTQLSSGANNFKVEPKPSIQSTPNQVQPTIKPHKSALNMAGQTLSSLTTNVTKPAPKELVDPFLDPDPMLKPSRPVVDPNKETTSTKRLRRPGPSWKTPTLPDSPHKSKEETGLVYITEPGDSFWSISQSIYNDGRFFRALYKYNQPHVPEFDSLQPGTKIGTPTRADLIKLWPDLCPGVETEHLEQAQSKPGPSNNRVYITRRGDTVFDIARQRLGQASRYSEILKLNQVGLGQETSHLTPLSEGVRLVIPQ